MENKISLREINLLKSPQKEIKTRYSTVNKIMASWRVVLPGLKSSQSKMEEQNPMRE